jgi:hypothetical protein
LKYVIAVSADFLHEWTAPGEGDITFIEPLAPD